MNTLLPDIYRGAAADIEKRGWCQDMELGENGEICLRFAIDEQFDHSISGWTVLAVDAYEFLARRLGWSGRHSAESWLEDWNDEPHRTTAEVIAKLRDAAVAAEAVA